MTSSSTSQHSTPNSSSQLPSDVQAWYTKVMSDASKPKTPAQIKAAGDIKIKIGVLLFVGITCSIMAIFGGILFIIKTEHAKDFWVIISPIITAGVTGTIAFLTGEKAGSGKN